MKINDFYWKVKRVIRRNKKTIKSAISITLTVAVLAVVAYAAYSIYKADKIRAASAVQGLDESPIQKIKKPGYDYRKSNKDADFWTRVAENDRFALDASINTGEIRVVDKKTQHEWWSNPEKRKDDPQAIAGMINSQMHVTFWQNKICQEQELDNYTDSIKQGCMTYKQIENGIRFEFAFPTTGIIIPVQYTLSDDGLLAEIVTSEIQELWSERWVVKKIDFLPYFGAGSLTDEGYLFVPDGSGALINFNNMKHGYQSFNSTVYGANITLSESASPVMTRESISLPVFGEKCNDNAFLAVILNGDASSGIKATTSRKTSSYNHVYSTAIVRDTDYKHMEGRQAFGGNQNSDISEASDNLHKDKNYAVKYFFLESEKANYVGMSDCYREFLEEREELKRSELADKKFLVLDVIGAVSIEKYVFGVKTPVITPMTTYNQVCDIVKELKAQGVENLIINYVGAYKGGLNSQSQDTMKVESALGSAQEFRDMVAYLKSENVQLFLESNPIDIYKTGNGYNINGDATKTFFNSYGFQYRYALDTYLPVKEESWRLLTPNKVPGFVQNFAESTKEWNVNQISVNRLGDVLYSNYDYNNYISRPMTKQLWMQSLSQANEIMDYVMVHDGNAYALPYTDVITDLSNSNSDFDMEDSSIPFYQIAFQNVKVLTAEGINTTVDYQEAFLKALESGSSIKFNLFSADPTILVGTVHNNMTSYSYQFWKETIIDMYKEYQSVMQNFAGDEIVNHEVIAKDVVLTEYESGKLIINYSDEIYIYDGVLIEANGYAVLAGGTK